MLYILCSFLRFKKIFFLICSRRYGTKQSRFSVSFGKMLINFVPIVFGVSLPEAPGFHKASVEPQPMWQSPFPDSAVKHLSSKNSATMSLVTCLPIFSSKIESLGTGSCLTKAQGPLLPS